MIGKLAEIFFVGFWKINLDLTVCPSQMNF